MCLANDTILSEITWNVYQHVEEPILEEEEQEEEINEEDEQDLSNEIRRQYQQDREEQEAHSSNEKLENESPKQTNKRNLSKQSNNTPTSPKLKRRRDIQPDGSGAEADTESDTGSSTNTDNTKSYLHSTLRDQTPTKTTPRESPDSKTVPETPDNVVFLTRYHSQQIKPFASSLREPIQSNITNNTMQGQGQQNE